MKKPMLLVWLALASACGGSEFGFVSHVLSPGSSSGVAAALEASKEATVE